MIKGMCRPHLKQHRLYCPKHKCRMLPLPKAESSRIYRHERAYYEPHRCEVCVREAKEKVTQERVSFCARYFSQGVPGFVAS